jgi:hypothetical protein
MNHLVIQEKLSPLNNNILYLVEIASHAGTQRVVEHYIKYPLLGYKSMQLARAVHNTPRLAPYHPYFNI